MMSAGIHRVDYGTRSCKRSDNRVLDRFEFGPAIITPADSRLVGDHDDRNVSLVGGRDGVRRAWNDSNVFDPMQIVGLLNNDAIAIQEQSGPARHRAPYNLAPDAFRVQRIFCPDW